MNKKKLLQVSVAAAIASVLLIPGNIFVIGQVLQDTTAPSITITQPIAGANLNMTNVTVAGTATDNVGVASVEIFLDSVSKGNSTLTPANGTSVSWSMTLTLLAQGTHDIIATAKDNAGNIQSAGANFVDTVSPSILAPMPITVQANAVGGASSTHPNITAFLAGALTLDAIDPNLTVTNNAPALFPLGTTTVTFTSTDDAGNSASDSSTVTVVDTTLPSITITQPANGTKFNTTSITVSGTVSDTTLTSVEIFVDNLSQGNAALSNTTWAKALTLAQGLHTVTAKAKDGANNTAVATVSFIVDIAPPLISIVSPTNNATLTTTNVKVNGTASDANGIASVVVSIDSGPASLASFDTMTGKWTLQTTLTSGAHTIKATATDMAGNKAMTSVSIMVQSSTVIDAVIPSIEITSLGVTAIVNGTNANKFNVTIAGTASDNNGLASVQVKIDNGAFANAIGTTAWSFKTTLSSGSHTITAKATDNAGNMNAKMISLTLQSTLGNQLPPSNQPPTLPPVQGQNIFSCNGQQLNGKLELEDASATFIDCEIRGSLRMEDSTAVFKNSVTRGDLKVEDSDLTFDSSELRGNLHMEGGSLVLKDNMIRGNVKVCDTEMTQIGNNIVKGHIEVCGDDDEEDEEHEGSSSGHSGSGSSDSSHEKGNSDNSGKGNSDDKGKDSKDDKDNEKGKGNSDDKGNSGNGNNGKGKGNGKGKK